MRIRGITDGDRILFRWRWLSALLTPLADMEIAVALSKKNLCYLLLTLTLEDIAEYKELGQVIDR